MVQGRVLDCRAGQLVLWWAGATSTWTAGISGDECRCGDLVEVTGPEDAPHVEVLHHHDTGVFPAAGSERADALSGLWQRLRARAGVLSATRAFFTGAGFLEVQTPTLVRSPGTEVHLEPVPASLAPTPGAARERWWLITSPELHIKRLLAAGAPPLFEIARVFRDGERGGRHRPEFTMLEWYRPFAGWQTLLSDCEAWITHLAGAGTLSWQGKTVDLSPPWPRVPWFQALRERGGVANPRSLSPDEQLQLLVDRVEPTLGRGRPEFLVDYPIEMASLARPSAQDPTVAERFELYIEGMELANGFGELTDAAEQRRRCEADNTERRALGLAEMPVPEAFLEALEDGIPPTAGIAVGLDRIIMLLLDVATIDEVLAF